MVAAMRVRSGGTGRPTLLMVHGLGATGDVWNGWWPVLAELWPGRWLAPDLPGHGLSGPLHAYSFGALAASLSEVVRSEDRLVVLGHSLGGVLGLTLASGWFGVSVEAVAGLGIKVDWTADELDKARALAQRPVAWVGSRDEAAVRDLRTSGLTGLITADDAPVDAGLQEENGMWRLAMDPTVFGVGAPDMPGLLAAARSRVVLARGDPGRARALPSVTRRRPADEGAHVRRGCLVEGLACEDLAGARLQLTDALFDQRHRVRRDTQLVEPRPR